jgi:metal-responsive CopG/Arc/MetJ family transcriptional regulator
MLKKKEDAVKVTISVPKELLDKIDASADKLFLSRSSFITSTMAQYINGQNAIEAINAMVEIAKNQTEKVE